jgi:chorismate mutase/prephenate dehydratase
VSAQDSAGARFATVAGLIDHRSMSGSNGDDDVEQRLAPLRERIDALDRRLVELLNERARVVIEIGNLKRGAKAPIYAPHREAAVLRHALHANAGPLPNRTIEGIFRELMSGSFALEQPLRIGYLGPPGSFSHVAAVAHFGSSVSFEDLREIAGVFTEVQRGHVDYGLVPIENSRGGAIAETLDAFRETHRDVNVYAEVALVVRHSLLANCEPREVRRVYSKHEVFAQCRRWLATQYPGAELVSTASSSHGVREAFKAHASDPHCGVAAIGSKLAGELYGVKVLFEDIEDNAENVTRFFVIARQRAERTGDDKTSVMFTTRHHSGALVGVLQCLAEAGINLTHIDKRPSGKKNWSYTFFIDAEGHRDDEGVEAALRAASAHCQQLDVLGSYPRAARVL